jgi:predicted HD superfamily hydrolase involved in NAD metabolism
MRERPSPATGANKHVACDSAGQRAKSTSLLPSLIIDSWYSSDQRDRIIGWLQQNVPSHRLDHILRVEEMAVYLAHLHSLPLEQAAQAGLMHDLAKYFKADRLLQQAKENSIELDPILESTPHLLHADISAIVAHDEFNVRDTAILEAIQCHTLGHPGMSPLSCVVYLADSLEPGRGNTPELETLRHMSEVNLYEAVWHTCDYSLQYLLNSRCIIHPRAVLTRNWAMTVSRNISLSSHDVS